MPPSVNAQSAAFPATYGNFLTWFLRLREVAGRLLFLAFCEVGFTVLRFHFCTAKLFFLYSPAKCRTNFPNGRHNASTVPKSSELKSGPALDKFSPFRLTCITPTTFPSNKIGALMIF
jgi:hypothetical protein